MSLALTSFGPLMSSTNFFEDVEEDLIAKFFTFKTISVTSSLTPLIEENSCKTLSICIAVTAAPCIEERSILLSELPIVCPNPFSSGSAITFATDLSLLLVISNLLALIKAMKLQEKKLLQQDDLMIQRSDNRIDQPEGLRKFARKQADVLGEDSSKILSEGKEGLPLLLYHRFA